MNLIEIFAVLKAPETDSKNLFNAISLEKYPFAKIAINSEEFPVILISSKSDNTYLTQKNIRLKYLELTHNIECKVSENDKTQFANFTVIVFKSNQSYLQTYFLHIAKTLLKSLSANPTQQEVLDTFKNFVEIFRSLSDTPNKTIQGIWAELLIIETSRNPETLLNYWHNIPEEKFDFNADVEKLEVKSSSNLERIHIFASEQLSPSNNKQVIIASLFTKQITHGLSIADLITSIIDKINNNELSEKLFSIVNKTLGNSVEQSIKIKFDYELAKNSLRFYRHQDISKIEKVNIPYKVSEVRYKSDLTDVKPIIPSESKNSGQLYEAI